MSEARTPRPGYVVTYPNRERASSRVAQLAVMALLVVSAALILAVTIGGWSKLEGLIPVNIAWAVVYLVIAFYIGRWARGLLPIAAALGALMLTFAVIAASSLAGVSWSDRAAGDYARAQTPFGGAGLAPHTLNALVIVLAVVQAVLAVAAMRAFTQGWNIEFEVSE